MRKLFSLITGIFICSFLSAQGQQDFVPLKELFKKDFLVGVAVNGRTIADASGRMVIENFNTITCENEMKPQSLLYFPMQRPAGAPQGQPGQAGQPQRPQGALPGQPQGGQPGVPPQGGQPGQGMGGFQRAPLKLDTINGLVYNWASADRIADFARSNNLKVRGHTLVWHSQTPAAFFTDDKGNQLTKEQLYARLKDYMTVVMNRYRDVVFCWDVVNEALADKEGEIYRTASRWYQICGKDYIAEAFRIARSVNPNVKLIYNDYDLVNPAKLERAMTMLTELKKAGVPIDGVGMQAHWSNDITAEMLQNAITRFSSLGLEVQITELDVTTYTSYHGEGAKNQVQQTQPYSQEVEEKLA
ncbi:MAG TPA: endo-1,4-beta-xylanase, partial [Bacteroidales bacterium]|nr:endo-1,4-beta-xylanase [Bacteroidales bacterium]